MTGPKLTSSKSPDTAQGLRWLKLELMPPPLLVPAVASPDDATAASLDRAVMTSPSVAGESLRRRLSWDSWLLQFDGGQTALQSPRESLQRLFTGRRWQ